MAFDYPDLVDPYAVQLMFQDASVTATGGGTLRFEHGVWQVNNALFLAVFTEDERDFSSTLREILGVLWCLTTLSIRSKKKIVFACDDRQTVDAIKFGSNIPLIQFAAERIFNKCCWPVWLPREHRIMKIADKRSRLKIPHDQRSPPRVVEAANKMAIDLWGSALSFDQAASHLLVGHISRGENTSVQRLLPPAESLRRRHVQAVVLMGQQHQLCLPAKTNARPVSYTHLTLPTICSV